MDKEIVVTGINGFVGEHLARHLKTNDYIVHGVGREDAPSDKVKSYVDIYTQADLLDQDSVRTIPFKQARAIIHLAGLASVADSFKNPDLYLTGNATMTENLLKSAYSQGFQGRVVAVSTGALYDASQPMPLSEESEITESSPYAAGKKRAEDLIKHHRAEGRDVVIARPFNHIGPGQEEGFLIPDLYKQLQAARTNGDNTILVGNLNTRRDYTDVRDIADAYLKLATARSLSHNMYNISSGVSHSGFEMLGLLIDTIGAKDISPIIDEGRVRPTDAMDIIGDSSRLRNELGWDPRSNIQIAIEDFVKRKESQS